MINWKILLAIILVACGGYMEHFEGVDIISILCYIGSVSLIVRRGMEHL